jgi:hypothetical protein
VAANYLSQANRVPPTQAPSSLGPSAVFQRQDSAGQNFPSPVILPPAPAVASNGSSELLDERAVAGSSSVPALSQQQNQTASDYKLPIKTSNDVKRKFFSFFFCLEMTEN